MISPLKILVQPEIYAVCRLDASARIPEWAAESGFFSATRTRSELSIVCEERGIPTETRAERRRRLLQIEGTLAFTETGVLASIATPLAEAGISIFVTSTFDTDYFLVRCDEFERASEVLRKAGHQLRKVD